jgi:histidinol-phosphate aminotransferase
MTQSFKIHDLARPCLKKVKPYFYGEPFYEPGPWIKLSDNENPYASIKEGRYPNPFPTDLQQKYADYLNQESQVARQNPSQLQANNILFGNGSTEIIDIALRAFCQPEQDPICITPPTFGLFQHLSALSDIRCLSIPLNGPMYNQLDLPRLLESEAKMIFLCQPTNPVGSLLKEEQIRHLLDHFKGIVVVDECYIEFSDAFSWAPLVSHYPNLIVIRTFSKAWGLAGHRCGVAIACPEAINALLCLKLPFSVSRPTLDTLEKALGNISLLQKEWACIKKERERMRGELHQLPLVTHIFDSQTNFLLVQFKNYQDVYECLLKKNLIVKQIDHIIHQSMRITIGTPLENLSFLSTLEEVS